MWGKKAREREQELRQALERVQEEARNARMAAQAALKAAAAQHKLDEEDKRRGKRFVPLVVLVLVLFGTGGWAVLHGAAGFRDPAALVDKVGAAEVAVDPAAMARLRGDEPTIGVTTWDLVDEGFTSYQLIFPKSLAGARFVLLLVDDATISSSHGPSLKADSGRIGCETPAIAVSRDFPRGGDMCQIIRGVVPSTGAIEGGGCKPNADDDDSKIIATSITGDRNASETPDWAHKIVGFPGLATVSTPMLMSNWGGLSLGARYEVPRQHGCKTVDYAQYTVEDSDFEPTGSYLAFKVWNGSVTSLDTTLTLKRRGAESTQNAYLAFGGALIALAIGILPFAISVGTAWWRGKKGQ